MIINNAYVRCLLVSSGFLLCAASITAKLAVIGNKNFSPTQLEFRQALANFGRLLLDVQLLFAALKVASD